MHKYKVPIMQVTSNGLFKKEDFVHSRKLVRKNIEEIKDHLTEKLSEWVGKTINKQWLFCSYFFNHFIVCSLLRQSTKLGV